MTSTLSVSLALTAKFRSAADATIGERQQKVGAEGRDVLERFRRN